MSNIYKGPEGKLLMISDIANHYDNCKSIETLKELIDEIKDIADNELKRLKSLHK